MPKRHSSFRMYYSLIFLVLGIGYALLSLLPSPNHATLTHYALNESNYRWLILPIVIFLLIIWVAGYYGSLRVKLYSLMLGRSPDGQGFKDLSNGIMILAVMLPLTVDVNSIIHLITQNHPGSLEALTIINNYFDLVIMGAAMILINRGAESLAGLVKLRNSMRTERIWIFASIAASAIYGYLVVSRPASDVALTKVYYLPHWLLLLSLAIPYLFFWYSGLRGAYLLFGYQKKVRGKIYKIALRLLSLGIAVVVVSSILTRVLTTVSAKLSHLNLTPLLAVIYGLLVVIGAGYVVIALGAKKLRRIEEA